MSKIMYNGLEYASNAGSVSLSQAEYDALVSAGTVNPAVAYFITDSDDVTCNLGDLTDVNVTGASVGDIIQKTADGWEKVTPDSSLSTSSTNVIQNQAVANQFQLLRNSIIINKLNFGYDNSWVVTLPITTTTENYANCILYNAHQGYFATVSLRTTTGTVTRLSGSSTVSVSSSDSKTYTLTVSGSNVMWGLSTLIINYNT